MKALTWQARRRVEVTEVPDPRIEQPTDAIVRITSTAICGSDLHLYELMGPFLDRGDVLGHEAMGVVEEVGAGIRNLRVGQRVVVPFNISCGECFMCVRVLHAPDGGTLAVVGLGPVGQFAARVGRHLGYDVIGIDPVPERRAMAERHGIRTLDQEGAVDAVLDATEGRGADAAVDAVGMEAHGNPVVSAAHHAIGALPAPVAQPLAQEHLRGAVALIDPLGLDVSAVPVQAQVRLADASGEQLRLGRPGGFLRRGEQASPDPRPLHVGCDRDTADEQQIIGGAGADDADEASPDPRHPAVRSLEFCLDLRQRLRQR